MSRILDGWVTGKWPSLQKGPDSMPMGCANYAHLQDFANRNNPIAALQKMMKIQEGLECKEELCGSFVESWFNHRHIPGLDVDLSVKTAGFAGSNASYTTSFEHH